MTKPTSSLSRFRRNPSSRTLSQIVLIKRGIPRESARDLIEHGLRKDLPRRARHLQPVQNVGLAHFRIQRAEPALDRHPLHQRGIQRQDRVEARQPEEDEGDELAAGNLQIEEPPQLLHQLPLLEHVRLVDQYHRLPTRFVQLHQPLVDLGQDGDLFLRRLPDADLGRDPPEQPLGGDGRMDDDQQRRLVLLIVQPIQHAPRQGRLPGAHVPDDDRQPLHGVDGVHESGQHFGVLVDLEEEAGVRRVGEGLLPKLVELFVTHRCLTRVKGPR